MSAIWGIVDLKRNTIQKNEIEKMTTIYRTKKIDRIDTFSMDDCYLYTGLQYVTNESHKDQFPYHTDTLHGYLVADVILDNRKELIERFALSDQINENCPDGEIMYQCIGKDMDKALDVMLGAYAFAYYEPQKDILNIANDVVGNRSVYYAFCNGRVYFSTLLEPLIQILKPEKNERWLVDFLAQDNLIIVTEARETPYQNIYRVEPGELITFSPNTFVRKAYWDPFKKRKTLRLHSDEEYKNLVCKVFSACVKDLLRSDKETAILLSGGLDSNAVAAYAAPALSMQKKKLYSFTSVPSKEYHYAADNGYYIDDERPYIAEVEKMHTNLIPAYIEAFNENIWQECVNICNMLEIPFKSVPNVSWLWKAYKQAAEKGCKIILSGQYGNITISYGDFGCLFTTLLKHGNLLELVRQVNLYSKRYGRGRKWIYKEILSSSLKKHKSDWRNSYLKEEVLLKFGIDKRFYEYDMGSKHTQKTFAQTRKYMYDKTALRQIGECEVKLSLDTGVVHRDPTRDKRLIELVLSLPLEQFVRNGRSRRLVREYMKDLIPGKIVDDDFHKGRQGADTLFKIQSQWSHISSELTKKFSNNQIQEYLNIESINRVLTNIDEIFQEEDEFAILKLIYTGLASSYLRGGV